MLRLLKAKSLRFWVALGMVIALGPLVVSAGIGYVLLDRGVVAPFNDVAWRQRAQVLPALHLRVLLWETLAPVDQYLEDGNPVYLPAYRNLRERIETEFADLNRALQGESTTLALVQRARDQWAAADRLATELISVTRPAGDAGSLETLERFHGEVAAASDTFAAIFDQLDGDIEDDHDRALLSYERSIWLAGIAAGVSLLAIALGVFVVGRILSGSVGRLVTGAARFAEGDRNHRIDVQVPPELHRVAEAFNDMIGRIHESEAILAELAHRDGLTGLANRRAFDAGFAELQARIQRYGEPGCVLVLDIDHFKRINDTYGHTAGDGVLRAFATVMAQSLRPFDRVYRVGGEEFAVLLPNAGKEQAKEAAERLRRAVAATPVPVNDTEIRATVSIGIAEITASSAQSAVIKAADAALYRAKTGGRNRVIVSGDERRRQSAA